MTISLSKAFILFAIIVAPAVAASYVQNGGNVTAINNLVISGKTYNVTFGTGIDTTFNTSALALTAEEAVAAALDSDPTVVTSVGPSDASFIVCYQSAAAGSCDGAFAEDGLQAPPPGWGGVPGWGSLGVFTGLTVNVDFPAAQFTLVSAPEPGVLAMIGLGFALTLPAVRRRQSRRS